jgi:DNA-binding NarL/FixJ family response regulator
MPDSPAGDVTVEPPAEAAPIRVALVDDQPMLRLGYRMFLQARPELEIVGEAEDGRAALDLAKVQHPDVMLMDVQMPGWDGITATEAIVKAYPQIRVLILTTFNIDDYILDALRAGASGFVLKDADPDELVAAIKAVAAGDAIISPAATRRLLDTVLPQLQLRTKHTQPPHSSAETVLTNGELEVLRAVAQGLSNREIAGQLHLSEGTVKVHVGRLLNKLDLRDRVQAVVYAYESGLITPS